MLLSVRCMRTKFADTKPSNSAYLLCKSRILPVILTLTYQILNFGWKETF